MLGGDALPWRRDGDWLECGIEVNGGLAGRVQVVVKGPVDGGIALGSAVLGSGLVGGIGAQQVVEGIPAGNMLDDQAAAGEFVQHAAGLGPIQPGQASGGGNGDVRARMQPEQPE